MLISALHVAITDIHIDVTCGLGCESGISSNLYCKFPTSKTLQIVYLLTSSHSIAGTASLVSSSSLIVTLKRCFGG